jgi:hypothetical protein
VLHSNRENATMTHTRFVRLAGLVAICLSHPKEVARLIEQATSAAAK